MATASWKVGELFVVTKKCLLSYDGDGDVWRNTQLRYLDENDVVVIMDNVALEANYYEEHVKILSKIGEGWVRTYFLRKM